MGLLLFSNRKKLAEELFDEYCYLIPENKTSQYYINMVIDVLYINNLLNVDKCLNYINKKAGD